MRTTRPARTSDVATPAPAAGPPAGTPRTVRRGFRVGPALPLFAALLLAAAGCDTSLGPAPPPLDDVSDGGDASASEAGTSGPSCNDYCTLVVETEACRGALSQYASFDVCMNTCSTFAGWPSGGVQDGQGNTIGCRINAVNLAVQDVASAERHCASAGPSGGNVCGSWCDVYCDPQCGKPEPDMRV